MAGDGERIEEVVLHIGGLCLLVAEPAKPGKPGNRLHVLMPVTKHGEHTHQPVLACQSKYVDGAATAAVAEHPLSGIVTIVNESADRLNPNVQAAVVNMTELAGRRVNPGLVRGALGGRLAARFTLELGHATGCYPGARWDFLNEAERELAPMIIWTIRGLSGARLDWEVKDGPSLPRLKPDDDGKIELYILHDVAGTPHDELPPSGPYKRPPVGATPKHFATLYDLLTPSSDRRLPRFKKPVDTKGVDPYQCMMAQAELL